MLYTLDSKTLQGFSDFIPANNAADTTTLGDKGGISHSKIKGCGGNAFLPTLILACVLLTVACSLDCLTKSNPNGIFLI